MSQQDRRLVVTLKQGLTKEFELLIKQKLQPQLAQFFGYNALLYSSLAKLVCGDALRIKNKVVIDKAGEELSVRCCFDELPISSDSIDLALLPLILEQSDNPHRILREVERVLIPEGVIILIGRNPYSWKGMYQKIKRYNQSPVSINDISQGRVEDWLRLLGLEVEKAMSVGIVSNRLQKSNGSRWVKKIALAFCNYFCSYYIIIARKKVSTLTPIRDSWRRNKHLVPSRLAEPSIKTQVDNWIKQLK